MNSILINLKKKQIIIRKPSKNITDPIIHVKFLTPNNISHIQRPNRPGYAIL